ncbi:MAG: hypothetical protein E7048_02675 [Lentisphaerae bacterium]|nr:hypothetical protein [Lentisphaerota bacterium]
MAKTAKTTAKTAGKRSSATEKKQLEKSLQICESSRAQLILQHPFVGRLGIQIPFVPVNDSRIHTIATNGKVIYFRPEWVCSMPPVTMTATVAHTIWTAALCHSFRRGEYSPGRFDLASDIEVYKLLQVEKVNMARKPDFAELFAKHLPVEEIIAKLPERSYGRHPDSDVHLYTAGVISIPQLPGEEKQKEQEKEQNISGGEGENGKTSASQTASGNGECDKKDSTGDNTAQGAASMNGQSSETLNGEEHHEADCECDPAMREVWRQRIIEAGQHYKMTYGTLPGELAGLVEFFSAGRINYLQLLRRYLGQCSGGEAHWLPPARRFIWQGQYLPSRQNPKLDIVVAVDTSGSIEEKDFQDFFGEIGSIVQSFQNYQLTLLQCDTRITDVQSFSREKPYRHTPVKIKGGGGTSFVPVFEYLKQQKITPRILLYYTDGEGDFPEKAPAYPVFWVLPENTEVPWGKKLLMADSNPGV